MNPKFLLAAVLLLAPAVYGCLVFEAHLGGPCEEKVLFSTVIDNNNQVCTKKGLPTWGGVYDYGCFKPNYTAQFDTSTGVLKYGTDHGTFSVPTALVHGAWVSCQYGCTDAECWVDTSEVKSCGVPAASPSKGY